MKLDRYDRKILTELDKNSRLSYTQVGKKVKLSKEVTAYRVNKLVKNGVITQFQTIIALSRLGFFNYKMYIQLHGLTEKKERALLEALKKMKEVVWVALCEGRWDVMVSYYARNIQEFAEMKKATFSLLGKYIKEYAVIINEDGYLVHREHLLEKKKERELKSYLGKKGEIILKKKEMKLLQLLAANARETVTELSKKSSLSTKTVIEKIREFKKNQLIQTFTIGLNLNSINYTGFKICIQLNDFSEEAYTEIVEWCKNLLPLRYIIKTVGPWEIELELETKETKEAYQIIKSIKNTFPQTIKDIESVNILEEIKLEFFPSWE